MACGILSDVVSSVILVVILWVDVTQTAPDVQLATGIARGYDKQAEETLKPYSVYYGIPFAEPPVGQLRFSPPQPYIVRDPREVITSETFRSVCYQKFLTLSPDEMSEDCLHLNIFSPQGVSSDERRKVMVFVHGGAFFAGSGSSLIPTRLVTDYDVIVVSIQYRVAAFGFLSSGDAALPGNLGLHDQIMALQWVKDNIGMFGGDPDDVTIFGVSAGSVSISALSISPVTNGLFTKAIMESGTIFTTYGMQRAPRQQFYQHAFDLGCLSATDYSEQDEVAYHAAIVECLRSKPAKEILSAQIGYTGIDMLATSTFELDHFGPVVDTEVLPMDPAFLMANKTYLQKSGTLQRSYIVGVADNEGVSSGLIPEDQYENATDPQNVASLIKSSVRGYLNYPPTPVDLCVVNFMYTYPRQDKDSIPIQKVFDLQSDTTYTVPAVKFVRALVEASPTTPVYLYELNTEPKLKDPSGPIRGTSHGMGMFHVFDMPEDTSVFDVIYFYADLDPVKFPIISTALRSYLTSFAKTGIPVASIGETWPRFDRQQEKYLAISSTPKVLERMFAQRVSLWIEYLPKLARSQKS